MDHNVFSDYGSGSSTRSSWNSLESWPPTRSQVRLGTDTQNHQHQSADLLDLMVKRSSLQDMMDEFKLNGYDSPYNPEEDRMSSRSGDLIGMGPSSVYLRQKSWPEPEATPVQRLPRPKSEWIPSAIAPDFTPAKKYNDGFLEPLPVKSWASFVVISELEDSITPLLQQHSTGIPPEYRHTSNKVRKSTFGDVIGTRPTSVYLRQTKSWPESESAPAQRLPRPKSEWIPSATAADFTTAKKLCDDIDLTTPIKQLEIISAEQVRVLNSLPNAVLYGLLRDLEQKRNETARIKRVPDECRFCKNNGERESYYRSHVLKDQSGRVTCPVLRKFVCKRCGARGDHAHTVKYCPLSTDEERFKSSAMMRSVRLASGRRRGPITEPSGDYVMFGDTSPSFLRDYRVCAPLDPLWADLEQKLTLYLGHDYPVY